MIKRERAGTEGSMQRGPGAAPGKEASPLALETGSLRAPAFLPAFVRNGDGEIW